MTPAGQASELRQQEGGFDCVWFWRKKLPARKGEPCRVVCTGRMNSVLVEFPDGHRVVTSRYAVRRLPATPPDSPPEAP